MSTPDGSSASLLEPIDKPLPTFASDSSSSLEEWTVLKPGLPLSPDTLQKVMCQTGEELKRQSISGERYPKLGDTTCQQQETDQRPVVSRYSSMHQLKQKKIPSVTLLGSRNMDGTLQVVNRLSDPFGDDAAVSDPVTMAKKKTSISNLTAAAAAVEASTKSPTANAIPRQTKTSSLRARLSAGQLIRDEQTRVHGSTESNALGASGDPPTGPHRRDSYQIRKEPQTRRSNDSLQLSVRTKASVSSLRKQKSAHSLRSNEPTECRAKGHAPAQFVGGSRRPGLPPRPSSRSSSRNAPRGCHSGPSTRSPDRQSDDPLPTSGNRANSIEGALPIVKSRVKPRKSSIPVPSSITSNARSVGSRDCLKTSETIQTTVADKVAARKESAVPGHSPSSQLRSELEAKIDRSLANEGSVQVFRDANEPGSLAAIEESPQHAFTTKHISMKAPEYGPSLRVSPSAERLIMGTPNVNTANKENQPISEKLRKGFFQKATNGAYKQPTSVISPAPAINKRLNRPLSSHGMLQSSPRHEFIHSNAREKKVKSANMSSTFSMDHDPTPDSCRTNTDACKTSVASSNADLFFDAQERPRGSATEDLLVEQKQEGEQDTNEAVWIAPIKEQAEKALTEVQKTESISSEHNKGDVADEAQDQSKKVPPCIPLKDSKMITKDSPQFAANARNRMVKQQAQTPTQSNSKTPSSGTPSNAGSYPPRSSSRVAHPSYTARTPSHSPLTTERALFTAPKDDIHQEAIQNNLGSLHGYGSAQIDIKLGSKQSFSVRDSTAQESFKSSGSHSMSRNPFSNIRNLFNKRASTPDPFRSNANKASTSTKASLLKNSKTNPRKASVTVTGSPFPPIDSIPSIYRPTLASNNRANTLRNASLKSSTATPPLTSPAPTSVSSTTTLAINLLAAARDEQSSPRKERLLQISRIMVDAITQARDAEKAAEEAKMAARKADVAKEICEGLVGEVGRLVKEGRGDLGGFGVNW